MRIDQFVHTLNYGDAISSEAVAIKRILRSMGIESEIYSINAHDKMLAERRSWKEFSESTDPDEKHAVLLHYSLGSPLNDLFRRLSSHKRAIVYHNLTPVEWFTAYNFRVASDLTVGRQELPELVGLADVVLADSDFNKSEIAEFASETVELLPLPLDDKKWSMEANSGISSVLTGHGGKNFLHVGRLAPNKSIEDILKIFYFYHHKINKESRLWLIGNDVDTELYSFELRRLTSELRLKEAVEFVGGVADSELKSFYQHADAYICMSEHEGFCVPLLEAMYFGVPVLAYDACAVSQTLGEAGVLVAEKSPAELAEVLHLVTSDSNLRSTLVAAGKKRASEFTEDRFKALLTDSLVSRLFPISTQEKRECLA